jgi:CRP-like cAMP-binding protein
MPEETFEPGHVFFRPGDPGERAYLLHEGRVEMLAGQPGLFTRVGLFEAGEVFGEMALIEERPRAMTARAVTAGRATPMTRDEFEHLLTHDPARTRQYLRSLFERLRSVTARLAGEVELVSPAPPSPQAPAGELILSAPPVELPPGAGKPTEWAVVVHPLTRKAAETLPDEGLRATRFPLRIGRAAGPQEPEAFDLNDLWLLDDKPYNVSRNHCEIDVSREGPIVRDRGSHIGCVVNDEPIGGRAVMGYARLQPGDNVLVVGSPMSPYQFRVTVGHA